MHVKFWDKVQDCAFIIKSHALFGSFILLLLLAWSSILIGFTDDHTASCLYLGHSVYLKCLRCFFSFLQYCQLSVHNPFPLQFGLFVKFLTNILSPSLLKSTCVLFNILCQIQTLSQIITGSLNNLQELKINDNECNTSSPIWQSFEGQAPIVYLLVYK